MFLNLNGETMAINSKKKGNKFELVVAKLLTQITGFKWYRVGVSSGARFTTQGAEKFRGDITTDNKAYKKYIIESKATKTRVSLEDLVNDKSKFNLWIKQTIGESEDKWLLVFKANNGRIFALEKKTSLFGKKFFPKHFMILFDKFKVYKLV